MSQLVRGLIIAALMGHSFPAFAQMQMPQQHDPLAALEARLQVIEAQNQQLMCRPQAVVGNCGPGFLGTPKHNGLIAGIEYLHWAVRQPGLEYGITDVSGGLQDRGADGSVLDIDSDYDSGWRATLGYRFDSDGCNSCNRPEFLVTYTTFKTEQDDSYIGSLRASFITADNTEDNDTDNGTNDITPDDLATSANASFDFDLSTLDFQLAQTFSLTRTLDMRFAAIARIASMDEEFRVTYNGGDFGAAYTAFRNWDYSGAGLMLGTQMDWKLTNRLSLNVGGRGGALLGRRESRYFFPDDEVGLPTDVRHNTTRLTPVIEMAAMLNYSRDFCGWSFNMGAGYEFTNYFNMADDRLFTDSHQEAMNVNSVRDLSLDGFVARISMNY